MEDDEEDDDALDADGLKRQEAIDKAIRAVERHGMTYADAGDVGATPRRGSRTESLNTATANTEDR